MPRALVAISEGSEELEAIAIVDILRRGKVSVTLASVDRSKTVKCARGTVIVRSFSFGKFQDADALITDVQGEKYDAIILPGGLPGAVGELRL